MKKAIIIDVFGDHKAGKTTVISRVGNALKKKGVKFIGIKVMEQNKEFALDRVGSDTWRVWKSGALCTVLITFNDYGIFFHDKPEIQKIVEFLPYNIDFVFVEGPTMDTDYKILCLTSERNIKKYDLRKVIAISGIFTNEYKEKTLLGKPVFNAIAEAKTFAEYIMKLKNQ